MIRKSTHSKPSVTQGLAGWHSQLVSRRNFLLGVAGGSLAALFAGAGLAVDRASLSEAQRWQALDALQRHLLPSEPDSPGAMEIRALDYLRFVVADPKVDAVERRFILQGVDWLEDLSRERHGSSFVALDGEAREGLLRQIAASPAGENWLSTLILYLMEALLCDPAYGGNPQGVGWRWLRHTPGFPRPDATSIYPRLPL